MMLSFLLLAIYLFIAGAVPTKEEDGARIMNGKVATEGQFPFAVSLQDLSDGEENRYHICTISLITKKTCLGAAHCVVDKEGVKGAENLCGIVGSFVQDIEQPCHDYAAIHAHEDYDMKEIVNDIALFIFEANVNLGGNVDIVKLAGPSIEVGGQEVTALGWGKMTKEGDSPNRLRYTLLNVAALSQCEKSYGKLRGDQVCLSGDNTGTCEGDSGGPIVLTESYLQIAVVSYGQTECDTKPSVNTDVRKFIDWILAHAEGTPEIEG